MNIKDILSFGGLQDAVVVAGLKGAENEVTSVSVLEVAETKIKTWVLEKQLYITSFYAIMQNYDKQMEVIRALHEKKAAGLVICHIDLFIKKIHEDIIELCNSLDFPLIVAQSERPYVEIINPIILKLSGNLGTEYGKVMEMQNKLIQNIATKKDINFIYKAMAEEYGGKIVFLDVNRKLVYPRKFGETEEIRNFLDDNYHIVEKDCKEKGHCIIDTEPVKTVIMQIQTNGYDYGTIIAECLEDGIQRTLRILNSFASLCTLILTKNSRIKELEIIKKQEYLSDLITWNFRSDEVAIKMGQDVDWNITNKGIMVIVNLNNMQESIEIRTNDYKKFINEVLYDKIKNIVKFDNKKNLIGLRSDIFIILLEIGANNILDRAYELGEKILNCCNENLTGTVSIGISGEFTSFKSIPNAYIEATDAVKMGRTFFGENKVISMRDLGFYKLIREISDMEKFNLIKENCSLGKLKINDNEFKQDLYQTLKSLIYNNMSADETARDLFVHKNTVNYRKKKIIEILGYEPWNMPHLLNTLVFMVSEYSDQKG
ncbi:MAG: PucR family transcriptional regulator ligand-binding domain-containing protein [Tissierellaceae bacterium]